jgi:hypothetical protein
MNRYDTPAPTELLEQVQRLGLDAHIKRRDGLVADDERRVQRDDTGGGHPFGTDCRTARWDGAVDRRVEADHVEQLGDPALPTARAVAQHRRIMPRGHRLRGGRTH